MSSGRSRRKRKSLGDITGQENTKRRKLNDGSSQRQSDWQKSIQKYIGIAIGHEQSGNLDIALQLFLAGKQSFGAMGKSPDWQGHITRIQNVLNPVKKPRKLNKRLAKKERTRKASAAKKQIHKKEILSAADLVDIRTKLQCQHGRRRSEFENKLIVQCIAYNLSHHKMSLRESKESVRVCIGAHYRTVDELWEHYLKNRDFKLLDRRTLKERVVEDIYDLNEESGDTLFREVCHFAYLKTIKTREGFHCFELVAYLKEKGFAVSKRAATEILRELNYNWTDKDEYYGQSTKDSDFTANLRTFCLKMSHGLQLERDGGPNGQRCIRAAQDESWGNMNMNNNFFPCHSCDRCNHPTDPCFPSGCYREEEGAGVLKTQMNKGGKGKRLLFSHVITRDGLLNGKVEDLDPKYLDKIHVYSEGDPEDVDLLERRKLVYNIDLAVCSNVDNVIPSAEFAMRCGKGTGDYHQNMDNPIYKKMVVNKVLPAKNSLYSEEDSLLLLLDQAPYHVTRTGFVDVSKASKPTILKWLVDKGCQMLVVTRRLKKRNVEELVSEVFQWNLRDLHSLNKIPAAPKGPSKDELLYAAYKWAQLFCPDDLRIDIEVTLNEAGEYVIWNVANCPQYNPSEFLNNHSKKNMREDFQTGRNTLRLHEDLMRGINGGIRKKQGIMHRGIDAEMCRNWFDHCLKILKLDGNAIGLQGEVIDWWTPDCGVSVFDVEEHCPFSPKRLREMESKFSVDTSCWTDTDSSNNSNTNNRAVH